jgi:hypothetical protein
MVGGFSGGLGDAAAVELKFRWRGDLGIVARIGDACEIGGGEDMARRRLLDGGEN